MARCEEIAQGVRGWWVPSLDPQKEREEQKMASFGLIGERDCELWALWGVNQVEPGSLGKTDGSGGHVCLRDTVPGTQGDGQARGQQDREVLFSCCGALISKTKAWDPGSKEGCGWGHRIRDENPPHPQLCRCACGVPCIPDGEHWAAPHRLCSCHGQFCKAAECPKGTPTLEAVAGKF